jgi:hypothetical protein
VKHAFYVLALCTAACGGLNAQTWEIGIMGGYPRWSKALLGSISPEQAHDDDTRLKGDYSFGASVTVNTKGYYGFELGYLKNITQLTTATRQTSGNDVFTTNYQDRLPVHIAYFNPVVYFMPKEERWRPFVTGGVQAYEFRSPHVPNWTADSTRHYGANFGGGVKLQLVSHALLRLDVRDYIGGKPYKLTFENAGNSGGRISMIEATAGFSVTF